MNVLIIGSGGREHALGWKIAQSKALQKLFIAPGNAGTRDIAENVAIDVTNSDAVVSFCQDNSIDLVVVGPEAPLVAGLADDLRAAGILTFGPSKAAAQLEGSKAFTKKLCDVKDIPTAAYGHFQDKTSALAYLDEVGAPVVVKADGLAAGKGVTVAMDLETAKSAIEDCFSGSFGAAGSEVVIEEFLQGEEASVFALCDGKNFVTLASSQDHKRAFDGDEGPNTGGMGAYSPAPVVTDEIMEQVERDIIAPTIEGMAEAGNPFQGVLYAGLMLTAQGPKLIEYNVRFGDPECQVLMLRLNSDLLPLLLSVAKGELDQSELDWIDAPAMTVVMATQGYPGNYAKGSVIRGLEQDFGQDAVVFHAGTKESGEQIEAHGGRVLNVTAKGADIQAARDAAYAAVDKIDWPEGFYRTDIGKSALT